MGSTTGQEPRWYEWAATQVAAASAASSTASVLVVVMVGTAE